MIQEQPFSVHVLGAQLWDPVADNLDIEVRFVDGRRYGATFFTTKNIDILFKKNRATGECAGGLYLWSANMIIVEELSMDVIERTVDDLMKQEEFEKSFSLLV
jgi:hypothetical protein